MTVALLSRLILWNFSRGKVHVCSLCLAFLVGLRLYALLISSADFILDLYQGIALSRSWGLFCMEPSYLILRLLHTLFSSNL